MLTFGREILPATQSGSVVVLLGKFFTMKRTFDWGFAMSSGSVCGEVTNARTTRPQPRAHAAREDDPNASCQRSIGGMLRGLLPVVLIALVLSPGSTSAETWAFVVGIDDYNQLDDLRFCGRDADLFRSTLIERNGVSSDHHIQLVTSRRSFDVTSSPTSKQLRKAIPDFLSQVQDGDTVVFFFSGHGLLGSNGRSYLAPKDCDPARLDETALDLTWIREQLLGSKAALRLFFVDACYSGNLGQHASRLTQPAVENVFEEAPSIYTIVSCSAKQRSLEWPEKQHGLFSYWLCRGLQGAADADGDARISLDELYGFVFRHVSHTARRLGEQLGTRAEQTPIRSLNGNTLGVPMFRLTEKPAEVALAHLAAVLDDLIRASTDGMRRPKVAVLEFANRFCDGDELRGRSGSLGILLAETVQAALLKTAKTQPERYVVQERRFVTDLLAQIDKGFGVDDLQSPTRLLQIRRQPNPPEIVVVGTFQRFANPERLRLQCDLLDVATGEMQSTVHTTMLVDRDLWPLLGDSVEIAHEQPAPAPANPEAEQSQIQALPAPSRLPAPIADSRPPEPGPAVSTLSQVSRQSSGSHPLLDSSKPEWIDLTVYRGRPHEEKKVAPLRPVRIGSHVEAVFDVEVGDEYELDIANVSGDRLALIILVDGLSLFAAQRVSPAEPATRILRVAQPATPQYLPEYEFLRDARPWLFPPQSRERIDGWHFEVPSRGNKLKFETNKFLVTQVGDSLAGQSGYLDQIGQITIVVYGTRGISQAEASQATRGIGTGAGRDGQREYSLISDWTIDRKDLRAVYHVRYTNAAAPAPVAEPSL